MSRLEFPSDAIVAEDLPSGTEATVPMTASILKGRRKSRRNYLGFGKRESAHEKIRWPDRSTFSIRTRTGLSGFGVII